MNEERDEEVGGEDGKGFPSLPSIISITIITIRIAFRWGMKLQIRKLNYPPDIERGRIHEWQ